MRLFGTFELGPESNVPSLYPFYSFRMTEITDGLFSLDHLVYEKEAWQESIAIFKQSKSRPTFSNERKNIRILLLVLSYIPIHNPQGFLISHI